MCWRAANVGLFSKPFCTQSGGGEQRIRDLPWCLLYQQYLQHWHFTADKKGLKWGGWAMKRQCETRASPANWFYMKF
jgi:hypothetical protein